MTKRKPKPKPKPKLSLVTSGMLYRVLAPHFVAGIVVAQDGAIIHAAPILSWAKRGTFAAFKQQCLTRGWRLQAIDPDQFDYYKGLDPRRS